MIKAKITYQCGGCDASHTTEPIRMTAHSQPVNYGSWKQVRAAGASSALCYTEKTMLDAEDHGPDGWIVYDPHTKTTYCSTCWYQILNDEVPE